MELVKSRLLAVVRSDARISGVDCERWVDTLGADGAWNPDKTDMATTSTSS